MESKINKIVGTNENPVQLESGQVIINKKSTKKHIKKLVEINDEGENKTTTDGTDGGILKGKPHYDKNGNPTGGIPAKVDGERTIEVEGDEFVVSKEASEKHWKELSKINTDGGNGVPINKPSHFDDDPKEYKKGGNIIEFNPNHVPPSHVIQYALKIKNNHPKIWKLGGNIFGNQAFENLYRAYKRGYWLDSEEWMYIKWRSYVARHKKDFRIEGVIAMLKWADKVEKGWSYMKNIIQEKIDKSKSKKKFAGGGLIAPNGKPSNLTPEQYKLVRTPAFKKWFGDWEYDPSEASKVIDENGEPLVVYHGTNEKEIKIFKKSEGYNLTLLEGIYFTQNKEIAKEYGNKIYSCFLKIKKLADWYDTDTFEGYDGVIAKDTLLREGTEIEYNQYVVFSSNQIKLADGSNTTFDSNNSDIRFAGGGEVKFELIKNLKNGLIVRFLKESIKGARWEAQLSYENNSIHLWKQHTNNNYDIIEGKTFDKAISEKEAIDFYKKEKKYIVEEYYQKNNSEETYAGGGVITYKNKYNKKYGYDLDESHDLNEISKDTGVSLKGLQQIYNKGIGAYKTNPQSVRPNVTSKEQWAMARVYSAVMKGKASEVDANELRKGKMEHGGTFYTRKYKDGTIQKISVKDYEKNVYPNLEKGGLIAPNGKPSNLTTEQYKLVRTPEFKAWFGDWENNPSEASKVVDENGEPLVVNHTYETENQPNVFQKSKEVYINGKYKRIFQNDDIYKKLEGIYGNTVIDGFEYNVGSDYWEFWFTNKIFGGGSNLKYISCFLNIRNLYVNENGYGGQGSFGNMKTDYDGISGVKITNADSQKGVDYYIVLFSNQIKLADGTNTTFDSNNPDIRYADGGEIKKEHKDFSDITTLKYYEKNKELGYLKYYYYTDETISIGLDKQPYNFSSEMYIDFVRVNEDVRNKGIAKKLIKRAISDAKELGIDVVTLKRDSGMGCNYGGDYDNYLKKLYSSIGFIETWNEIDVNESAGEKNICAMHLDVNKYHFDNGGEMKFHLGGDMSKHLAPNGKPSNLNHEQWHLVRTPEFKAWFGDWEINAKDQWGGYGYLGGYKMGKNCSLGVDENGEPKIFYHQTTKENYKKLIEDGIINFEIEYGGGKTDKLLPFGFYLKPNSEDIFKGKDNYFQITFFLNIRSLETFDDRKDLIAFYQNKFKGKYDKEFLTNYFKQKRMVDCIRIKKDFDFWGVNFTETLLVLNKNQIKLADGSNTTFDSNNPDIRFKEGGNTKSEWIIDGKEATQEDFIEIYQRQQSNRFSGIFDFKPKKVEYFGDNEQSIRAVKDYYSIANFYDEKGKLKVSYMNHIIRKAFDENSFVKFANAFRKHIDSGFHPRNRELHNQKWSELALTIISDDGYDISKESDFRNFAKQLGIDIPKNENSNSNISFKEGGELKKVDYKSIIAEKQTEKANELRRKLIAEGFKGISNPYTSKTDFGVSTYFIFYDDFNIMRKFRISDHSVTNIDRIWNEYHYTENTDLNALVDSVKSDINQAKKNNLERNKLWDADKERTNLADKKWDDIKSDFAGLTFKHNDRTYQNLEEFSKNKNRSNIYQKSLGTNRYGQEAFYYEWTEPIRPNEVPKLKPSREYIEQYKNDNNPETMFREGGEVNNERFIVKPRIKFGLIFGYVVYDTIEKINLPYEYNDEEKYLAESRADLSNALYESKKMVDGGNLSKGVKVEKEHKNLYQLFKQDYDLKGLEMPVSEQEFYSVIAKEHINENPKYYSLLQKYVEKKALGGEIEFKLQTPTGEPSKLTYLQQVLVRTEGFKKWFGDWESAGKIYNREKNQDEGVDFNQIYKGVSKVIDWQTLEPQVVYHGTVAQQEFFSFDVSRQKGVGRPYGYFAEYSEYSLNFTQGSQRGASNGVALLYQCFLNIKNPFRAIGKEYVMKERNSTNWQDVITGTMVWDAYQTIKKDDENAKKLAKVIDDQIGKYLKDSIQGVSAPFWYFMARDIKSDFKTFLMLHKYDGVQYTEEIGAGYDPNNHAQFTPAWTIFNPTQVKLADGRNLNFNPMYDDIRMEEGGTIENNVIPSSEDKKEQLAKLLFGNKYAKGGNIGSKENANLIDLEIKQIEVPNITLENRKFVENLNLKMKF